MITHQVEVKGFGVEDHSTEEVRELVYALEERVKQLPQVDLPVEHSFADGLYMRKIKIPQGMVMAGRVHKQNDLQIIFYGDISVMTEDGMKRISGPATFTAKAGVKPFGYAHEETLWATVHHTHLTDLKEIEAALFEDEETVHDFITGQVKEVLSCQP